MVMDLVNPNQISDEGVEALVRLNLLRGVGISEAVRRAAVTAEVTLAFVERVVEERMI